jgi:hypothetical protein
MSWHGAARRINPWNSIGVTDNGWFDFLSQQPGIDEMIFQQPKQRKKISQLVIPETIVQWGV